MRGKKGLRAFGGEAARHAEGAFFAAN